MNYRRHLQRRAKDLKKLPLDAIHSTGMPVWLITALVVDALERCELGAVG